MKACLYPDKHFWTNQVPILILISWNFETNFEFLSILVSMFYDEFQSMDPLAQKRRSSYYEVSLHLSGYARRLALNFTQNIMASCTHYSSTSSVTLTILWY